MCASHTLLVPYSAYNIACFLSPSSATGAVVTSASLSLVEGTQTFLLLLLFIEHFWPRQWKNLIFYSAVMTGWVAGLGVYRLRFYISGFFFLNDLRFWHFQLPQDPFTCFYDTHTHCCEQLPRQENIALVSLHNFCNQTDQVTHCRIHGYLSRIQAFTARSEELLKSGCEDDPPHCCHFVFPNTWAHWVSLCLYQQLYNYIGTWIWLHYSIYSYANMYSVECNSSLFKLQPFLFQNQYVHFSFHPGDHHKVSPLFVCTFLCLFPSSKLYRSSRL